MPLTRQYEAEGHSTTQQPQKRKKAVTAARPGPTLATSRVEQHRTACHEQNKQENCQSCICQQPEFDSLELIPLFPAPATSHAISSWPIWITYLIALSGSDSASRCRRSSIGLPAGRRKERSRSRRLSRGVAPRRDMCSTISFDGHLWVSAAPGTNKKTTCLESRRWLSPGALVHAPTTQTNSGHRILPRRHHLSHDTAHVSKLRQQRDRPHRTLRSAWRQWSSAITNHTVCCPKF